MEHRAWSQLAFVLGEAVLMVISGGVLFVLISRLSGPVLLGQYSLAIAWLMLFQGVSSFGIPEFLMREIGTHGKDGGRHMSHALLIGLCTGALATIIMLLVTRLFDYPAEMTSAISIASLGLMPIFVVTACRSGFMALRQMHWVFLIVFIEVGIVISASIYLLLTDRGVVFLVLTLVIAKTTSAAFALVLLHRFALPMRLSIDWDFMKQILRTIFTFGVGNMLGMLSMRINTIMVSVWGDFAAVGQFAAATKIMEIVLIVPNLFAQILMTRIAYTFNALGDRDPNRFDMPYRIVFAFIIPACVGGWVFARPIVEIIFSHEFDGAVWILRFLMIYCVVETADALMSVILKASHLQRADVTRLAFNPATNIALNLVLVPVFGGAGAALGRVGGGLMSASLRYVVIARELVAVNWFLVSLKPLLISVAVGMLAYLLLDVVHPVLLAVMYAAVTAVLLRTVAGVSPSSFKDMMNLPTSQQ